MRIVLSNSAAMWGGVQTVTQILARGLSDRGHDVRVFGFRRGKLKEKTEDFARFEPIVGGMDFSPRVLWNVSAELRRDRPDVVLTLMKKDTTMTALVAAMMNIPVVIRHANNRPLKNDLYNKALYGRLPALHIVNANATRKTLLQSAPWLSPDKIKLIYNGVDASRYDSAKPIDTGIPEGDIAIGYVGAFEPRKGVIDLANAWPRIADAIPNAHLVLCGDGSLDLQMRSMLKSAPRVHWLGHREDVPNVLRALDVLVLPSHVEGAPNVVLEAMASAVPVVATAVSGTPELIRDGVDGKLIPDSNTDALVDAVVRLASNSELRSRVANAARLRVLEKFTIDAMIDAYEEVLAGLAEGRRAAS
ncbi:MAG TPA: glycosyltransferase family 4 protein [Gemmatimonadaceae bacterium]|nr:glycosyltransferase family 4 protein [Gemmatimonadaceae bacterium]